MKPLSHLDDHGRPTMVDVGAKPVTERTAEAVALVELPPVVLARLGDRELNLPKGPVFQIAITAGIMAAKRTAELIPLCHHLPLDGCKVQINVTEQGCAEIRCQASAHHRTGVEMEALTGASIAALTVYDMCKGLSHEIVVRDVRLVRKRGGRRDVGPPLGTE